MSVVMHYTSISYYSMQKLKGIKHKYHHQPHTTNLLERLIAVRKKKKTIKGETETVIFAKKLLDYENVSV